MGEGFQVRCSHVEPLSSRPVAPPLPKSPLLRLWGEGTRRAGIEPSAVFEERTLTALH